MKTLMMTVGLMLMSAAGVAADEWKPRFALQLYSFRDRSFTDAVKTAKKLGFKYVEAYPGQPLGGELKGTTAFNMSAENRAAVKAFLADEKIKLVSYGVTGRERREGLAAAFRLRIGHGH